MIVLSLLLLAFGIEWGVIVAAQASNANDESYRIPDGILVPCRVNINQNNDTWGVRTLAGLRKWQQAEFDAVQQQLSGVRSPPYIYQLCSDIVYRVTTASDIITPLLDETEFHCEGGRYKQHCAVGSSPGLPHVHLYQHDCNYVRYRTLFERISFVQSHAVSIAAWDTGETSVSFVNCKWERGRGNGVISNAFAGRVDSALKEDGTVRSAMKVILNGCKIRSNRDSESTANATSFLVSSFGGTISMKDTEIVSNNVQVLLYGDASSSWEVSGSRVSSNTAVDGIYVSDRSRVQIQDTRFFSNFFDKDQKTDAALLLGGTVVASGNSSLHMTNTTFSTSRAFADVLLDSGSRGMLDYVAFLTGAHVAGPIFTAVDAVVETRSLVLSAAPSSSGGAVCPRQVYHAQHDTDDACLSSGICVSLESCEPLPTSKPCADYEEARFRVQDPSYRWSWPFYIGCAQLPTLLACRGTARVNNKEAFWICPESCGYCPL